jgi:hypothetical protein
MTQTLNIPSTMLQDIDLILLAYSGRTLPLYAEAENIRRKWLSQNVALEDIVEQFLRRAAAYNVSFEIDPSQAAEALRGHT